MIIKDAFAELDFKVNPVAKILFKSQNVKVIILAFKKSMILKEHITAIPAKLIIFNGKVKYFSSIFETVLNQYDEIEIPINQLHSVTAIEDSLCLLIQGS